MTKISRISKLANTNTPSLQYFILQAQGRSLYLQFLRVIRDLPLSERKAMLNNVRQEFSKAKLRMVYLPARANTTKASNITGEAREERSSSIGTEVVRQNVSQCCGGEHVSPKTGNQHATQNGCALSNHTCSSQSNEGQASFSDKPDFGPFTNFNREIDYAAMEDVMQERIRHGKRELKRLKEMVAMSITAQAHLAYNDTEDEIPIEDVHTQWSYPDYSPYDLELPDEERAHKDNS